MHTIHNYTITQLHTQIWCTGIDTFASFSTSPHWAFRVISDQAEMLIYFTYISHNGSKTRCGASLVTYSQMNTYTCKAVSWVFTLNTPFLSVNLEGTLATFLFWSSTRFLLKLVKNAFLFARGTPRIPIQVFRVSGSAWRWQIFAYSQRSAVTICVCWLHLPTICFVSSFFIHHAHHSFRPT